MSTILADDLRFSYGKHLILTETSFSLPTNSFTAIIGPNGGGKTTLLKLTMGLLKPQSGKILLGGKSPGLMTKKIGYVPQIVNQDQLFPLTTLELILLGIPHEAGLFGRYPSSSIEKAESYLQQFHLLNHRDKPFGSLSGGLMQRARLAQALISNPTFLFLDEPTANIDPTTQKEIFDTLFLLKNQMTILMVTHDLQAVTQKGVDFVMSVNHKTDLLAPEQVCQHFALGLYHPPLWKERS